MKKILKNAARVVLLLLAAVAVTGLYQLARKGAPKGKKIVALVEERKQAEKAAEEVKPDLNDPAQFGKIDSFLQNSGPRLSGKMLFRFGHVRARDRVIIGGGLPNYILDWQKFILTKSGPVRLELVPGESGMFDESVSWEGPLLEPAAPLAKGEGKLVVFTETDPAGVMSWDESGKVDKNPEDVPACADMDPKKVTVKKMTRITLSAPKSEIYSGEWTVPGKKEPYGIGDYIKVSAYDGRACAVLFEHRIVEDDKWVNDVGEFMGVLELKGPAAPETWLIFEAGGYEGFSRLGLRLTDKPNSEESDIDFYNIR